MVLCIFDTNFIHLFTFSDVYDDFSFFSPYFDKRRNQKFLDGFCV